MSKGTKKTLKILGGVALGVGAVYFAAGVAYVRWHGHDYWANTVGVAPGPRDFRPDEQDPTDRSARWWSYFVGRRVSGAILSFSTNPGTVPPN